MGCNAWNHAADCECGWGGDTGSSIRLGDLSTEGFLNPNARCPVCQEPVYFYSSPNGGKVFFDDIGYPWPKHPCTEHISENVHSFEDLLKLMGTGMSPSKAMQVAAELIEYAKKNQKHAEGELEAERMDVIRALYSISSPEEIAKQNARWGFRPSDEEGWHSGSVPLRDLRVLLEALGNKSKIFERFSTEQAAEKPDERAKHERYAGFFAERIRLVRLMISHLQGGLESYSPKPPIHLVRDDD